MKKLALAICLLVVSIAAQAQFEKGKMILNPSVTGLDFSYSKNDKAKGFSVESGLTYTYLASDVRYEGSSEKISQKLSVMRWMQQFL